MKFACLLLIPLVLSACSPHSAGDAERYAADSCNVRSYQLRYVDIDSAARLASSFGGGLGRLRETCGTVSGAAIVLGAVYGYSEPGNIDLKNAHYELVREFARRFRERCGSIVCRELLARAGVDPAAGGDSAPRTPEFYQKRPCPKLAFEAARIVDELLAERAAPALSIGEN